jgi:hypothetical protein
MSGSDPSKALLMQHFLKDLTLMLSGMAFRAAETQRAKPTATRISCGAFVPLAVT